MTKEKIIDGIKVEECSYYNKDNTPYCCEVWDNECEAQNCYYKQLKRLEQERDDLQLRKDKYYQQTLDDAITISDLITKCNDLKQENKELKAYKDVNEDFKKAWDELNKKYTEVLKLAKENADSNEYCLQELEKENKELKSLNKKICEDWEKEIKVYWNALEKIKDLCIHYKNTNDKCITNCYAHFIVTDLIQNKINEVLNEVDR